MCASVCVFSIHAPIVRDAATPHPLPQAGFHGYTHTPAPLPRRKYLCIFQSTCICFMSVLDVTMSNGVIKR